MEVVGAVNQRAPTSKSCWCCTEASKPPKPATVNSSMGCKEQHAETCELAASGCLTFRTLPGSSDYFCCRRYKPRELHRRIAVKSVRLPTCIVRGEWRGIRSSFTALCSRCLRGLQREHSGTFWLQLTPISKQGGHATKKPFTSALAERRGIASSIYKACNVTVSTNELT